MSNRDVVFGTQQLDDLLSTFAPKIKKNILRSALTAGAQVFKKEVLVRVPRKSGDLAKTTRVSSRIDSKRNRVTASVKVGNKKAPYALSVEFGTRAHLIEAPQGQSLSVAGRQYRAVNHPGATQHPFMRPAAKKMLPQAVDAVRKKIRERMSANGLNVPASVMDDLIE